jgi:hypothetical protein
MTWRRRGSDCWDAVGHCGERCRRSRNRPAADTNARIRAPEKERDMDTKRRSRPQGLTRRELARLGLGAVAAWTAFPWARRARAEVEPALVTDFPANEALLAGVQFAPVTARSDQRCANCVLYQPREEGLGKCALFQQGHVPEEAWCISWGPKPS